MAEITQSMVDEVRSQLHEIQMENMEMEREIAAMCSSIRNAYNHVAEASSSAVTALGSGVSTLNSDENTLRGVDNVRQDIEEKVKLYKNVENAYKNIRQLNNQLRYQRGSEKTVKSIVIAMLDNEEKALVSEESLVTQAEKIYLDKSAQSFFLSHIMMDLQLRGRGEVAAANRAREQAVKLDPRNAAWIYFMVAVKRGDAAEKAYWVEQLISRPLVGAEKANLKMLALLALTGKDAVASKIGDYIGINTIGPMDRDGIVANILASYKAAMTIEAPTFQYIEQYIVEKNDLKEAMRGAINNEEVAAAIQKVSMGKDDKLREGVVTMMLDRVIEGSHSEETGKILKEIEKNQHVIDAKGVLSEATAMDLSKDIEDVSDIKLEDCLYEWLNERERYNGKREISAFAYGKLNPSYQRAYQLYLQGYRSKNKNVLSVDLGDYQTQSALTSASEEVTKLNQFCKARCESAKSAIKNTTFILLLVFGALLLAAGIVLKFLPQLGAAGSLVGFLGGIGVGCLLFILAVVVKFRNYRKKLALEKQCEEDLVRLSELMQHVVSDVEAYRTMFNTYDAKALTSDFFQLQA